MITVEPNSTGAARGSKHSFAWTGLWNVYLTLLLCAVIGPTAADATSPLLLQPAANLKVNGSAIDLGDHAIPCVTDWNGDGRQDLLVGYRYADKIALFLNSGSATEPSFTNLTHVQAAGSDIYVPGAGCGAPAPWVCDYDHDGKRDLLVGSGADGTVWFFQNTNTDAQPLLAAGVQLLFGESLLSVGYRATPYVHDWDEDGLPDLFCGNGDGRVAFFRNTNSVTTPAYSAATYIQAGGVTIDIGDRSVVRIFDWDGDGLKDLVGSSSSSVYWCRNTNSNFAPSLQAAVALKAPAPGPGLTAINTGYRMRLDLTDWNHDGVTDLLLGNADGTVFWYEGYRLELFATSPVSGNRCALGWRSAPNLKYDLLGGATPEAVTNILETNVFSGGTLTSWTNAPQTNRMFFRVRLAP